MISNNLLIFLLLGLLKHLWALNYFAELNEQSALSKTYVFNFSQMVKYEVEQRNIFEVYQSGIFYHIYTDGNNSNSYQNIYFNSSDGNSSFSNYTLIDYDYQSSYLHFLVYNHTVGYQILKVYPNMQSVKPSFITNLTDVTVQSIVTNLTSVVNITNLPNTTTNLTNVTSPTNVTNITMDIQVQINSVLQVTNESYYIVNPGSDNNSDTVIYKYFRNDIKLNSTYILDNDKKKYGLNRTMNDFQRVLITNQSQVRGQEIRAKVCRKWDVYSDYLIIWNQTSYMQMWNCDYWDCKNSWKTDNDTTNYTWSVDTVIWGPGCINLYVQYNGYNTSIVYNEVNGNVRRNHSIEGTAYDFQYAGSNQGANSVFLLANNTFLVAAIQNGTTSVLNKYSDFANFTPQSRYLPSERRILINNETHITTYKFLCWSFTFYHYGIGMCTDCFKQCDDCFQYNGYCIRCAAGYQMTYNNSGNCVIPPPPTVVTPVKPPVVIVDPPIIVIPTNQTTNQTTNQAVPELTQKQKTGAYYDYEQNVAVAVDESFNIITPILEIIFKILSVGPLAWLFLNFMNYWSICSYYIFLGDDIPKYLREVLKGIYDSMNHPAIQILNDFAQTIYPLNQRLTNMKTNYQITSNFVAMNLENLIILTCFIVLLKSINYSISFIPKTNSVRKRLEKTVQFNDIIASQFISIASNFILPFSLLLTTLNFSYFQQILNLVFHVTFIGVSLMFPFFVIEKQKNVHAATLGSTLLTRKQIRQIFSQREIQLRSERFKTIQWIYVSNCNTVLPLLCVLDMPGLFYSFGFAYFTFGVWLSRKVAGLTVNLFILSLYPFLFHIFYVIIALFGSQSIFLKHNGSTICSVILLLGAFHELLNAIWRIIYFFFKGIRSLCSRSKTSIEQMFEQKKVTQSSDILFNKIVPKVKFTVKISDYYEDGQRKRTDTTNGSKRSSTSEDIGQEKDTEFIIYNVSKTLAKFLNQKGADDQLQTIESTDSNKKHISNLNDVLKSFSALKSKKDKMKKKIKVNKARTKKDKDFNNIEAEQALEVGDSLSSL